jgi:uncharacterized membrane protein
MVGGDSMRTLLSIAFSAALLLIGSAQVTWAQEAKVYDLGTYPGGTWAELHGINDFGVAVGRGDVAGDRRMIGVPLFGRNAGHWFESGVSSSVVGELMPAISNTGVIAGTITGDNGKPEAYAWMPNRAGFHLGTLPGGFASYAYAINHLGTFIVGQSFRELQEAPFVIGTAVVWTPRVHWTHGRPTLAWEIHALPTGGLEKPGAVFEGVTLRLWGGWGVNDSGQIAGDAYEYNADTGEWWEIAVVWNPTEHGREWKVQRLPMAADFPYTEALAINNLGEVVGDVWGSAAAPALWKKNSHGGRIWKLTVLPTLNPTPMWDVATSINDRGDVVGYCYDSEWVQQATRWNTHAPLTPAQTLGFPGDWSVAYGVNNFGIAVGGYGIGDGPEQAVAMKLH